MREKNDSETDEKITNGPVDEEAIREYMGLPDATKIAHVAAQQRSEHLLPEQVYQNAKDLLTSMTEFSRRDRAKLVGLMSDSTLFRLQSLLKIPNPLKVSEQFEELLLDPIKGPVLARIQERFPTVKLLQKVAEQGKISAAANECLREVAREMRYEDQRHVYTIGELIDRPGPTLPCGVTEVLRFCVNTRDLTDNQLEYAFEQFLTEMPMPTQDIGEQILLCRYGHPSSQEAHLAYQISEDSAKKISTSDFRWRDRKFVDTVSMLAWIAVEFRRFWMLQGTECLRAYESQAEKEDKIKEAGKHHVSKREHDKWCKRICKFIDFLASESDWPSKDALEGLILSFVAHELKLKSFESQKLAVEFIHTLCREILKPNETVHATEILRRLRKGRTQSKRTKFSALSEHTVTECLSKLKTARSKFIKS